jgi:hypothetical protein
LNKIEAAYFQANPLPKGFVLLHRYLLIFTYVLLHYIFMAQTKTAKLVELIRRKPILRSQDFDAVGIPRNYLTRFVKRGQLQKLGRGLYAAESLAESEHISLLEVSRKVPKAVICLL